MDRPGGDLVRIVHARGRLLPGLRRARVQSPEDLFELECAQVLAPCEYEWFARFDARAQASAADAAAEGGSSNNRPAVRASVRLHREEYAALKAELTERLLAITLEQVCAPPSMLP